MCLGIPEGMAPLRAVFSSLLRSSFLSELAPPSPLLPSPAQSSSGYLCRSPQSGPPPRGQPLAACASVLGEADPGLRGGNRGTPALTPTAAGLESQVTAGQPAAGTQVPSRG